MADNNLMVRSADGKSIDVTQIFTNLDKLLQGIKTGTENRSVNVTNTNQIFPVVVAQGRITVAAGVSSININVPKQEKVYKNYVLVYNRPVSLLTISATSTIIKPSNFANEVTINQQNGMVASFPDGSSLNPFAFGVDVKFNTGITGLNLAGAWIEYMLIGY